MLCKCKLYQGNQSFGPFSVKQMTGIWLVKIKWHLSDSQLKCINWVDFDPKSDTPAYINLKVHTVHKQIRGDISIFQAKQQWRSLLTSKAHSAEFTRRLNSTTCWTNLEAGRDFSKSSGCFCFLPLCPKLGTLMPQRLPLLSRRRGKFTALKIHR